MHTNAGQHTNIFVVTRSFWFSILSCYVKLTCVLVIGSLKVDKDSWERQQLWKWGLTLFPLKETQMYTYWNCFFSLKKHVPRQPYTEWKFVKLRYFWKTCIKLTIVTCSHISLTCLWVQAYSVFIVTEAGFIIQYDIVQTSCNTLV